MGSDPAGLPARGSLFFLGLNLLSVTVVIGLCAKSSRSNAAVVQEGKAIRASIPLPCFSWLGITAL
jgi:hypothetical protein